MRECLDPSEFGSTSNTTWTEAGSGTTSVTDSFVATDINGNGGAFSLQVSASGSISRYRTTFKSGATLRQFYIKAHVLIGSGSSDVFFYWGSGSTTYNTIRTRNANNWEFLNGTGTVKDTASAGPTTSGWVLFEAEVYLDNSAGFARMWQDGVQIMDFSGDTYQGGYAEWLDIGGNSTAYIDNFGINSVTLSYDGGTGSAPSVGQTITDGTTGATAVITDILSSNSSEGRLVLHDWDGTAFGDNNAVTTATLTAVNNAPVSSVGLDANSYRLGNEYIAAIVPNGNGSNSAFTGSDGNSTDNYLLVDEIPANVSEYVYATSSGDTDTYAMSFSADLPASNQIDRISLLASRVVGKTALAGLDEIKFVYRVSGGTEYESETTSLPTSDLDAWYEWEQDPSDQSEFTHAKLTASIEMGQKIV